MTVDCIYHENNYTCSYETKLITIICTRGPNMVFII